MRLLQGFTGIDERGAGKVLIETLVRGAAVVRGWAESGEEILKRRRALAWPPSVGSSVRPPQDSRAS